VDGFLLHLDGSSLPASREAAQTALRDDSLLWLDLHGTRGGVPDMLRDVFAFHPITLRDLGEFGQRPRAETFGDVLYLVTYAAAAVGAPLTEVHLFYSAHFVVTVHREDCRALTDQRQPAEREASHPPPGRPIRLHMLHSILDALINSFFAPLSDLDDQIDKLIEQIFARPSKDELAELLSLQRWLVSVRKLVTPLRDATEEVLSGVVDLPGWTEASEPYMRDLYDHVIRVSDEIDSYRDLLDNAMSAYLSMVSNRLNEVTKQLTIIATVFLPLSFLTGFFGQNFAWLTSRLGSLPAFLGLGIGTEVAAVAGLWWLFRRRGWL
jgi:magnesium transporter